VQLCLARSDRGRRSRRRRGSSSFPRIAIRRASIRASSRPRGIIRDRIEERTKARSLPRSQVGSQAKNARPLAPLKDAPPPLNFNCNYEGQNCQGDGHDDDDDVVDEAAVVIPGVCLRMMVILRGVGALEFPRPSRDN